MNFLNKIFSGGIPQLDIETVQAQRAEKPGPLLLDVREPSEFAEGHLPGAQLMPLGTVAQQLHTLPRERAIICICRSGARSDAAARQLVAAGFKAANLRGGMLAWERARLPITRGAK